MRLLAAFGVLGPLITVAQPALLSAGSIGPIAANLAPASVHYRGFQPPRQDSTKKQSPDKSVVYKNTQYGFTFSLPGTWKGYSILESKWDGAVLNKSDEVIDRRSGPLITIRHPMWTETNQRQDIPIMVFTLAQWASVKHGTLFFGAPYSPGELRRNGKYVFALPPRFEDATPTGWEEVSEIVRSKPLRPF